MKEKEIEGERWDRVRAREKRRKRTDGDGGNDGKKRKYENRATKGRKNPHSEREALILERE